MLCQAIETEVAGWIESHRHIVDDQGHRQVVRNGHKPTRTIVTGVGPVEVTQSREHIEFFDQRELGLMDP